MELIIALLILLLVLAFVWNAFSKDTDRAISCFCAIMIDVILTVVIIDYKHKDNPTSLDVFEGKTTLEFTYRDSIPIDSVVVFKEEFKK